MKGSQGTMRNMALQAKPLLLDLIDSLKIDRCDASDLGNEVANR